MSRAPHDWGRRKRAYEFARIIRSMAITDSDERIVWCRVLEQAAKDTWTQNHDRDFWHDWRGRAIADVIGLDIERVRRWARIAGIHL